MNTNGATIEYGSFPIEYLNKGATRYLDATLSAPALFALFALGATEGDSDDAPISGGVIRYSVPSNKVYVYIYGYEGDPNPTIRSTLSSDGLKITIEIYRRNYWDKKDMPPTLQWAAIIPAQSL